MADKLKLRIVLEDVVGDIVYGLQKGSGSVYETVQLQRPVSGDISFEFDVAISKKEKPYPLFSGSYVHGPGDARFIYIDIGTCAGDLESSWTRRLKIPLYTIEWPLVTKALADEKKILEARVPGKGKDGTPNCATVKPFAGWHII